MNPESRCGGPWVARGTGVVMELEQGGSASLTTEQFGIGWLVLRTAVTCSVSPQSNVLPHPDPTLPQINASC